MAIATADTAVVGGMCVDIFRALETIDPDLQIVGDQQWLPRSRIDAALKSGALDLICAVQQTSHKLSHYYYLDTVLFSATYQLVVRIDDDVHVNDWDDVRALGKDGIILTLHGFDISEVLEQMGGLRIDSGATTSSSNLKKLLAGRGRFYCHRSPGIRSIIKKAGLSQQVRLLKNPQLNTRYYMAVSRHMSKDRIYRLSRALSAMEGSGELRRIVERYQD